MKRSLAPAPEVDSISEAVGTAWLKIPRQVNNNLKSPPTPPTYPLRGRVMSQPLTGILPERSIYCENRDNAPDKWGFSTLKHSYFALM